MKLVKKNGSITGMEPILKTHRATKSFEGNEIMNNKLRDGPTSPLFEKENDQHIPSTVTVPSEYTDAVSNPEDLQDVKSEEPKESPFLSPTPSPPRSSSQETSWLRTSCC